MRIVNELQTKSPFEIDYLFSEWQAAYLYPNKRDSRSPIETILLRTVGKQAVQESYLGDATTDFTDNETNYEASLLYFPEDESKALARCQTIKDAMTAELTAPLEFVI